MSYNCCDVENSLRYTISDWTRQCEYMANKKNGYYRQENPQESEEVIQAKIETLSECIRDAEECL